MSQVEFHFRGLIVPVFTAYKTDKYEELIKMSPDGNLQIRGFCSHIICKLEEQTKSLKFNDVCLSIIPSYAEYLQSNGVKGVLINGTTGEGTSLSVSERKAITEAWSAAAKKTNLHLMVQIGGAPLPDVLELATHAEKLKVNSILCLPELYFKPSTPEELINYLQVVAAAAPKTPLLYYHIPMFSKVEMNMGTFLQTIGDRIPSFVGIKFTSNDLGEGVQALKARNGRFRIFLGNDRLITAGCVIGMDSFIVTTSNMYPKLVLSIIKDAIDGDLSRAKQKQNKLTELVGLISSYGNWVTTMKTVMNKGSINVGQVRSPLSPLSKEESKSLLEKLGKSQIMPFE